MLPFDSLVFDEEQLGQRQLLTGQASAGRGNTCFFTYREYPLVLRHYRRGGLVQRVSKQHYLYTGLEKTRAMREFGILLTLCELELPVSRPYACRVMRRGPFYRASLVTHRLVGYRTLAECLLGDRSGQSVSDNGERLVAASGAALPMATWSAVGEVIGRLHAVGAYHADLNAHNIMLSEEGAVSLIDFDRAEIRALPAGDPASGWCLANIERLLRSLSKEADPSVFETGFSALKRQWRDTLTYSISPRS